MKICVCVKIVPQAASPLRHDPITHQLDRSASKEINPADEYAVEEALLIRDRMPAEVVVVSMTPEDGADTLLNALSMGADRAVIIADPALAGSDLVVTSRVLAAALSSEVPDIVLFGSQAVDSGGAMLWSAVAERLGFPVISGAHTIELKDGRVCATRQTATDSVVLEATMPCVVALSGSANTPRYPSFRDILSAKGKQIAKLSVAELGINPSQCGWTAARTTVLTLASSPRPQVAEIVEDDGHAAEWLLNFMLNRGLP